MALETRSTDAKGRVSLPKAFANATVIIEHVSENELRIRKACVIPRMRFVSPKKCRSSYRIRSVSGSCERSTNRQSRPPHCGD